MYAAILEQVGSQANGKLESCLNACFPASEADIILMHREVCL
jgi:hypothetical protein